MVAVFFAIGCLESRGEGQTSFLGVEFGSPLSLKAINSKYGDDSCLWKEKCNSLLDFQLRNTSCYNYYPQSPLKGFVKYQVMVDNDSKEIVGVCAESEGESTVFSLFRDHVKYTEIYANTRRWLDEQFSDFSIRTGKFSGEEVCRLYTNNGLFARKRCANQAGLKCKLYGTIFFSMLKVQLFICKEMYAVEHSVGVD